MPSPCRGLDFVTFWMKLSHGFLGCFLGVFFDKIFCFHSDFQKKKIHTGTKNLDFFNEILSSVCFSRKKNHKIASGIPDVLHMKYWPIYGWRAHRGIRGIFFRGDKVIFPDFFPGVKCCFPVENSYFARLKTNFSGFEKWKAKKKKKKKKGPLLIL